MNANIEEELTYFNFSTMESKIYLVLIKHGDLNGSQISKILNCSRSTVYDSLKTMYEKGVVILYSGDVKLYSAKNPNILMEEITQKSIEKANILKNELNKVNKRKKENEYWNIKGEKSLKSKLSQIINDAKSDIYINSNYSLKMIEKELKEAYDRGVRIIHFSFVKQKENYNWIESYYNDIADNPCITTRIMIVIDRKKTLVADILEDEEITGMYTENKLMKDIISEHIHHDIYFTKLAKKNNKNLVENDILLNSNFENKQ